MYNDLTKNTNRNGQHIGAKQAEEPHYGGLSPELYEIVNMLLTFINTMDTCYNRCTEEERDK